jgi:hypothetical protein
LQQLGQKAFPPPGVHLLGQAEGPAGLDQRRVLIQGPSLPRVVEVSQLLRLDRGQQELRVVERLRRHVDADAGFLEIQLVQRQEGCFLARRRIEVGQHHVVLGCGQTT